MRTTVPFDAVLAFGMRGRRVAWGIAIAIAGTTHGVFAMAATSVERATRDVRIVSEVELVELPAKESIEEPMANPTVEEPTPSSPRMLPSPSPRESRPRSTPTSSPRAPGSVLTTTSDSPAPPFEAPVRFVTGAEGSSFGHGVVARGGRPEGDGGGPGTRSSGDVRPTGTGSEGALAITPAGDLSRLPTLGEADPCRGYFPSEAVSDRAEVTVFVVVRGDGRVARLELIEETPPGQGFGRAAQQCLKNKRFRGALDREGRPATAAARTRIRFSR